MPVTFSVANTTPNSQSSAPITLEQSIRRIVSVTPEACGANAQVMSSLYGSDSGDFPDLIPNAFVRAVHASYDLHLPLILSPDDVWLAIAQGFAAHVNKNAERLRRQFVQHEGTATIKVRRDYFVKGFPGNDWQGVFGEFSDEIAKHIGEKRDLLVSRFSTTGPIEKAASEVVLMDAMQSYFKYIVETRCGIPSITLLGTKDDWESVLGRAQGLTQFDCQDWGTSLTWVLSHFVAAFDQKIDANFWGSFYKHENPGSGSPYVTGGINAFFPYVNGRKNRNRVNPTDYPSGLSKAPFTWLYYEQEFKMQFLGGFVGVTQDPNTLAVRPVIGWAVADDHPCAD